MNFATFRAATELDQSALLTGWAWSRVHNRAASSGWYAKTDDAGAVATAGFSGSSVSWHTLAGPGQGVARVLIDGHSVGVFDLSGRVARFAARRFDGLRAGGHTIQVEALGERGAARRSGWSVAVDGFTAGGTAMPDDAVSYRWPIVRAAAASGRGYATSDDPGASLGFWFRGTAIRWFTVRGPGQGRAAVYIDGKLHAIYDGYSPTRSFGAIRRISGLTDSVHVIRIEALGTARPAARGAAVSIDGFEIT